MPPNLTFEIDDLEEPWNFRQPFDYIHSMMMTGSFKNWPRFYEQGFAFVLLSLSLNKPPLPSEDQS